MILRPIAGLAAIVTVLLLQATVIGPLTVPLPVSLPAVLVAAVGLRAGPAAGIGFGFSAGFLGDLGSDHPAGVLALVWLGVGLTAGVLGGLVTPVELATPVGRRHISRRSARGHRSRSRVDGLFALRPQASLAGALAGLAAPAAALVLTVTGTAADTWLYTAVRSAPAALLDAVLALAVVPAVGAVLDATGRGRAGTGPAPAPHRPGATTTDLVRTW
ncbi:MAG: hypothetical protein ABJA87_01460 [bacterium]